MFTAGPRYNLDEIPYHIYYDTSITNNDITGNHPLRLNFSETRSGGSLISNPSDYFFSIVRFEVQTPNLPVFIPQIMLNQTDSVNKTIYRLEFFYNGQSFGDYVYYEPAYTTITPPILPLSQADLVHPYYHIHTFSEWVELLNRNIQRILAASPFDMTRLTEYKFTYAISSGLVSFNTPVSWTAAASMLPVYYNRLEWRSKYIIEWL